MGIEARRRAIERFPELRCTERTEEVYRHWLDVRHQRAISSRAASCCRLRPATAQPRLERRVLPVPRDAGHPAVRFRAPGLQWPHEDRDARAPRDRAAAARPPVRDPRVHARRDGVLGRRGDADHPRRDPDPGRDAARGTRPRPGRPGAGELAPSARRSPSGPPAGRDRLLQAADRADARLGELEGLGVSPDRAAGRRRQLLRRGRDLVGGAVGALPSALRLGASRATGPSSGTTPTWTTGGRSPRSARSACCSRSRPRGSSGRLRCSTGCS